MPRSFPPKVFLFFVQREEAPSLSSSFIAQQQRANNHRDLTEISLQSSLFAVCRRSISPEYELFSLCLPLFKSSSLRAAIGAVIRFIWGAMRRNWINRHYGLLWLCNMGQSSEETEKEIDIFSGEKGE
jgi:hypothetical protein